MGSVAEVEDTNIGNRMAVKEVSPMVIAAAGGLDAFKKEAATLDTLHHQNLVQYRSFETEKGSHYIFTSLVAGKSLEDYISNASYFSEEIATKIIIQVLRGLGFAHSKGIVHRDIKPSNIMWDGHTAVVIDFGISRSSGSVGGVTQALFAGAFTKHFGAPEQQGSSKPDPRNDIYAVGVTMYDMVTGKHRLFPEMPADRYVQDPVTSLPGVSSELEAILMRAVAVYPQHRYASADEMILALEGLNPSSTLPPQGKSSPPTTTPRPKSQWDIRRT